MEIKKLHIPTKFHSDQRPLKGSKIQRIEIFYHFEFMFRAIIHQSLIGSAWNLEYFI